MVNVAGFNASTVKPNDGIPEAMPAGEYPMVIVESKKKDNKARTGWFIELVLQVVDGAHKGRKCWDRLNLKNPSSEAVAIAEGTLSAICRAVNVMTPQDTTELHNRPMLVQLKVKEHDGALRNEVVSYKALTEKPATSQGSQAPPLPSMEDAAPWQ